MFTKEDYREYFTMILEKETAMIKKLEKEIPLINDREIRVSLQRILKDEKMHAKLATAMFDYL